jgi:prevent-host-death family protein
MAKTAGVRELKTKLSEYLRDVKHGETVLVTEHGRVVAELVPPGKVPAAELSRDDKVRHRLLAEGVVSHLGEQGKLPEPKGEAVSPEELEAALEADREDRV